MTDDFNSAPTEALNPEDDQDSDDSKTLNLPKSLTGECLGRIVSAPNNMTPNTRGLIVPDSCLIRPTTKPPTTSPIDSASSSLNMEEPCNPPLKPIKISSPSTNRHTLVKPFDTKKDNTGK